MEAQEKKDKIRMQKNHNKLVLNCNQKTTSSQDSEKQKTNTQQIIRSMPFTVKFYQS